MEESTDKIMDEVKEKEEEKVSYDLSYGLEESQNQNFGELELTDPVILEKETKLQESILKRERAKYLSSIQIETKEDGSTSLCKDVITTMDGKEVTLKPLDNVKPISDMSLSEIGILTEPPFEGAVEGVDYVTPVDEVDEDGNPTGKKIIPGYSDHVRSKLDPFFNDTRTDAEKDAENEKMKAMILNLYGVEDPETGELRHSNLDDPKDRDLLAKQKNMNIMVKKDPEKPREDIPKYAGGFCTTPEDQGFLRSGQIPVDKLMFKLSAMANSVIFESQNASDIEITTLAKVPPYFAILNTSFFPHVENTSTIIKQIRIFQDMFINKYPFDKKKDTTMAGSGASMEESLPDLSLLSLDSNSMNALGIEHGSPHKMIKPVPREFSVSEGKKKEGEGDVEDYINEMLQAREEEEDEVPLSTETADTKIRTKLRSYRNPKLTRDPYEWCPKFEDVENPEDYHTNLKKWFNKTIEMTEKEREAALEIQKKDLENLKPDNKYKNEGNDDNPPEEEGDHEMSMKDTVEEGGEQIEEVEEMTDGDKGKEKDTQTEVEEKKMEEVDNDHSLELEIERSVGEPLVDWFCCFGNPEERDWCAVSAFFKRFVREALLIKLLNRDLMMKENETGGYVLGFLLFDITEHWKSVCKMDICAAGGEENLFPIKEEDKIRDLSEFILNCYTHTLNDSDFVGFSYINPISGFLATIVTDYVIKRIWKKPEDVVEFRYPTSENVFRLLIGAEDVLEKLTLDDVPIPQYADCEAFHLEWSYHWQNRQLVNIEKNLMKELCDVTDNSMTMHRMEVESLRDIGRETADVKVDSSILPHDEMREVMNGEFTINANEISLPLDRLLKYPKLLHDAYMRLHNNLLTRISVLSLATQMMTGMWVPLEVRKKFGYVPNEDFTRDMIRKGEIFDNAMKRLVFIRRANVQLKLNSVGLECTSPIYDILMKKPDDTYDDIDLDEEAKKCLFGTIEFPELDLVTDLLRYITVLNNPATKPSEEEYAKMLKEALDKKPALILPNDVDVGSLFSAAEMQRMVEVTEEFKDPINRDDEQQEGSSQAKERSKRPGPGGNRKRSERRRNRNKKRRGGKRR